MKRIIIVIATVLLVSAFIFGGCGGGPTEPTEPTEPTGPTEPTEPTTPTQPAKVIEWRFASFVPGVDIFAYPVGDWGKQMEELTDGRFKLYTYYADSLVKSAGLADAIEAGTCDMANMSTGGHSERFPFAFPFGLMGCPYSNPPHLANGVISAIEWLEENYPEHYEKFYGHTMVMWQNCPGPRSLIISNVPIRTLDDLKGTKLTATSAEDIMGFGLLGAVTVPLFTGDHYMGLQTGVIDGIHKEYNQAWLWRTFEVSKYRVENTVYKGAGFPTNVNLDSYNNLPADIKAIFDASYDRRETTTRLNNEWQAWHDVHKEWIEEWYGEHGYPAEEYYYWLPDEESKKWNDIVKPVVQDWIDRAEAKGLPGQEYWDAVVANADETREEMTAQLMEALPAYIEKVKAEHEER